METKHTHLSPLHLGSRLYQLRRAEGLTRQELTTATDIPLERLEALECGQSSLTVAELGTLSDHYDLIYGQLLSSERLDGTLRSQPGDPVAVLAAKSDFRDCINNYFGVMALVGDGKTRLPKVSA